MADLTSNELCNICRISYNAGLGCCALGSSVEGGRLICKAGRMAWIVAPSSTQVSRSLSSRNDAVTLAQAAAPCGDWYIPALSEQMRAVECQQFWDSIAGCYWTGDVFAINFGWVVNSSTCMTDGICLVCGNCVRNVRAVRKVFY